MSKSLLKSNIISNQVANRESLMRTLSANQPAAKKAVKEMVYVDTTPKIVPIKKEKLSSDDKKTLKLVKKDFKESKKNTKLFAQKQNELCLQIAQFLIGKMFK